MASRLENKISAWYELSSAEQRAKGFAWYPQAYTFCRHLARDNGITLAQSAGVVSALSPACYWDLNKRQAEALCNAHAAGITLEDVVVSTYHQQKAKAMAILRMDDPTPGRIERLLGKTAWKTKSFFQNILRKQSIAVTIDRHILAAMGPLGMIRPDSLSAYNGIAHAFVLVARRLGIRPMDLQAIVWITYKETAEAYSPAENHKQEIPF